MSLDLDEIQRIAEAGDSYGHISPALALELVAEVRKLRAQIYADTTALGEMNQELCELRKDKERLDSGVIMTRERDEFGDEYKCERRDNDLRKMIDEAMEKQT
jgi:hypothetical protein